MCARVVLVWDTFFLAVSLCRPPSLTRPLVLAFGRLRPSPRTLKARSKKSTLRLCPSLSLSLCVYEWLSFRLFISYTTHRGVRESPSRRHRQ